MTDFMALRAICDLLSSLSLPTARPVGSVSIEFELPYIISTLAFLAAPRNSGVLVRDNGAA
ncbi:hypothetical protein LP420_16895 [Massilia sp. B-10]|nr:hypothetical protein LP420_16895 [Massilia sp. B-10]